VPHFPEKRLTQIKSKIAIERAALERIAEGERQKVWGKDQIKILRETVDWRIAKVQSTYFPSMSYQAVKYARFKYVVGIEKHKAFLQKKAKEKKMFNDESREIIRTRKFPKSANENYTERLIVRFGFQDVSPSEVVYYCRMATIIRNLSEQKEADRSNTAYIVMLQNGEVKIASQDFAEQLAANNMPLIIHDPDGIEAICKACFDTPWQKLPMPK